MKTSQPDKYTYILETPVFEAGGWYSFQTYNGVIESCTDSRFSKFIGSTTQELEKWVNKKECVTALDLTRDQKDELLWEEEKRKRKEWEREHWTCMEGGDGYFG